MIFVTVGTHEQAFNRIVEHMDNWAKVHDEEVIIQTGYSDYIPKYATWSKLYPYNKMIENIKNARLVITHGGPSSFIMPLQIGKIPIVVPRQKKYNEHVNDHQLIFCQMVKKRMNNIILVEEIDQLDDAINNYHKDIINLNMDQTSNNDKFIERFEESIKELVN